MRAVVFALTAQGALTARRVQAVLPEADVFVSSRCRVSYPEARGFLRLAEAVRENFSRYDALIFLMATGIVVRTVAPLLRGKLVDPAVLVLDERARHVISLLSGHVGGANMLTRQLALALGSDAVITTATDVEGMLAPDAVAGCLGLSPTPHDAIVAVNRALLAGRKIIYCVESHLRLAPFYRSALRRLGLFVQMCAGDIAQVAARAEAGGQVPVLVTSVPVQDGRYLCMCPRRLIAGIGCRRGTKAGEIEQALCAALARIELPPEAPELIATTTVKKDEAGLREVAEKRRIPLRFYERGALQSMVDRYQLRESPFVRKTIGVGNVAEAAALAAAGASGGSMALGKTKFEKVTVALVWQKSQ